MKKLTIVSSIFLVSVVLTACGGGGSSSSATTPPPKTVTQAPGTPATPSVSTPSDELIIDNGRGTVNNQDTEKD